MDTAGGAQPALVADTWEDVERLMYAEEPVNFILQGKPASSLQWDSCPTAACVVDALRADPATRITRGRPPTETQAPVSMLETRDGRSHLSDSPEDREFEAWFRSAPLEEALASSFTMAHFQLERFYQPGHLLEGFDKDVLQVWKESLHQAGFVYDRCTPYIFISGARDIGSFHHDVSHVVAWQIEGTKRFCSLREPNRLHGAQERAKHGQSVVLPEGLEEEDVLAIRMDAGTILFNQLLTPHWVQSPEESVAFSINISHGGLHRQGTGKGLCTNEAELEALKLADPEFAAIVDVKRGWKKTQQGDKK